MRSLARLACLLALVAQLGCLHDEDPPVGTKLLSGHGFRSPFITTWPDQSKRVIFESPSATSSFGEVQGWNLDVIPLEGGASQQLAPNVDQLLSSDNFDHLFVRHDAFQAGGRTAATLRRINLATGAFDEYPSTLDLSVDAGTGRFTYQSLTLAQVAAGERPDLHFNDGAGNDIVVGKPTGLVTMMWGALWIAMGDNHSLQRISAPGDAPESFIDGVEGIWPYPDGSYAAFLTLGSSEPGVTTRKLVGFNFDTRTSVELPSTGSFFVLGYTRDGRRLMYLDDQTTSSLLHFYDVQTGQDEVLAVQAGVQIVRTLWRPVTGEPLFVDGNGSLFYIDPSQPERLSPIYITIRREYFSDDGKKMFATVTGEKSQITVIDCDELFAGRIKTYPLVPAGMKVSRYQPVYEGSQIVFWGYYGESVADLYIVDVQPGAPLKKLAPQVDLLNTNLETLVGLIHSSPQDGLSDLVKLDLVNGTEKLYARSVSDFALYPEKEGGDYLAPGASLVYIVNARTPSDRDGIWVSNL